MYNTIGSTQVLYSKHLYTGNNSLVELPSIFILLIIDKALLYIFGFEYSIIYKSEIYQREIGLFCHSRKKPSSSYHLSFICLYSILISWLLELHLYTRYWYLNPESCSLHNRLYYLLVLLNPIARPANFATPSPILAHHCSERFFILLLAISLSLSNMFCLFR